MGSVVVPCSVLLVLALTVACLDAWFLLDEVIGPLEEDVVASYLVLELMTVRDRAVLPYVRAVLGAEAWIVLGDAISGDLLILLGLRTSRFDRRQQPP